MAVEAHSPTEALVKFRHVHGAGLACEAGGAEVVTSISADEHPAQTSW